MATCCLTVQQPLAAGPWPVSQPVAVGTGAGAVGQGGCLVGTTQGWGQVMARRGVYTSLWRLGRRQSPDETGGLAQPAFAEAAGNLATM